MKKVLLIGLSVSFLMGFFFLVISGKEMNGELRIKSGSFIEGLKILHKMNGSTVWTLTASKADFIEGDDKAELRDVNLMIHKNGMTIHADKGIYDLSDKSFTTDNTVRAEAKDCKITAESIDYDVASGKIQTGGKVKFEGKSFNVEGKGMNADAEQKVSIYNDVKATFHK